MLPPHVMKMFRRQSTFAPRSGPEQQDPGPERQPLGKSVRRCCQTPLSRIQGKEIPFPYTGQARSSALIAAPSFHLESSLPNLGNE